jgi:hypothetical protein
MDKSQGYAAISNFGIAAVVSPFLQTGSSGLIICLENPFHNKIMVWPYGKTATGFFAANESARLFLMIIRH